MRELDPQGQTSPLSLAARCAGIELLVLDVDGVLTSGEIVYTDEGVELKQFHVRDGSGLKFWHRVGKRSAILTGRRFRAVELRARELGIHTVLQGVEDKLAAYRRLLADEDLRLEQVCFIADDVPDLPVLRHCGLAVAVADACAEVMADSHYLTRSPGGRGAVREVIELILHGQGHWRAIVEHYRTQQL